MTRIDKSCQIFNRVGIQMAPFKYGSLSCVERCDEYELGSLACA